MQTVHRSYLQFVDFYSVSVWSSYSLLGKNLIYTEEYPFVAIGEFLKRNKTQITIQDDVFYKRATIRINGKGISLRDEILGKYIGTKKQFLIRERQFLLSKIDARNGAFGVVSEELDKAVITGNFWTFDVDYNIINPHYLALLTGTRKFQNLCQTASVGTTNRNYLQEDLFLNFEIPLPPLEEQEQLVADFNKKLQEAEQLTLASKKLVDEIESYFLNELGIIKNNRISLNSGLNLIDFSSLSKWSLNHLNRNDDYDFATSKFKIEKIKNLLTLFEGGKTPSKSVSGFWNGTICWTSPKDFYGQYKLIRSEDRISEMAVKETGIKVYPKGVFLSVFRSGILQHSFPTVITEIETAINQDLKAYAFNKLIVNDLYYLYFVRVFQKYFLSQACKKSVTVESINTEDFIEIDIPIPPINIQEKIALHVEEINEQIKSQNEKIQILKQQAQQEFEKAIFAK